MSVVTLVQLPELDTETCRYCGCVDVTIPVHATVPTDIRALRILLPFVDAAGWTGIDGNGDPVCHDCWCGACTLGHTDADERDACEFGVDDDNPPCSADPDRIYDMRTGR